jgi:phage terminase large subunit
MPVPAELLKTYFEKPWAMVEEMFGVKPDAWQRRALEAFPHTPRMAMQSCTGPGKTALLAWMGWNFLLTRPHAVIGAASLNKPLLKATFWPELARWYGRSPILQATFDMQEEQIIQREHPQTWHLKARSWAKDANAEQIGNALRGFHGKYVMWLLDESGGYPDAVLPVCEAIFSGEPIEAHIVQAGNPTHLSGPLYFAAKHKDRWLVIEITADPENAERTPRVSVEHARQQIADFGADSPWVRVNIFGRFPQSSINALIGTEEVEAAMQRYWKEHDIGDAARVLGVDIARYGLDKSIVCPRRGIQIFPFRVYRDLNSDQGAAVVNAAWGDFDRACGFSMAAPVEADACFFDDTGGFGAGWGDGLRRLGRTPMGIHFGQKATNDTRYFNKRAEMYLRFVDWIRRGGALPHSPDLVKQLVATSYTVHENGKLMLAPKDEVKIALGGHSPDEADAAALTFAEDVTAKQRRRSLVADKADEDWNPYREQPMPPPGQFR